MTYVVGMLICAVIAVASKVSEHFLLGELQRAVAAHSSPVFGLRIIETVVRLEWVFCLAVIGGVACLLLWPLTWRRSRRNS